MKKLADRIAEAREAVGLNQSELARTLGVTPQAVQSWEADKSTPRGQRLEAIAKALSTTVDFLMTGKKPLFPHNTDGLQDGGHPQLESVLVWDDQSPLEQDEISVPYFKEVELAAGTGRLSIEVDDRRRLRFGRISLRNQGVQPENARCVSVTGNSMEPVLRHGTTVGVDVGNTRVIDGDMYAINHGGQLRVKQLYRLPGGGIRLRSFNRDEHLDEEYTPAMMEEQDISLIGRVFWSGGFH